MTRTSKEAPNSNICQEKKIKDESQGVKLCSFSVKIILTNPSGSTFKISMFKLSDDAGYPVTPATPPGSANAPASGNGGGGGGWKPSLTGGHEGRCSYSLWGMIKALSI